MSNITNNNNDNSIQRNQRRRTSSKDLDQQVQLQPSERDILVFKAQICEQSCLFEDMVKIMRELCEKFEDLSIDERNLLSCAYKNIIGSRRTSWRVLNERLQEQEVRPSKVGANNSSSSSNNSSSSSNNNNNNNNDNEIILQKGISPTRIAVNNQLQSNESTNHKYEVAIIRSILSQIECELKRHCQDVIDILTKRLIPSGSQSGESKVFYYKMKGDYIRYLCEICSHSLERKEKANESLMAYKTACDRAMIELPPTHPVRLGLMLNFSVFYYDIMKSPERSCRLAKQAFDDAIAELDTLSEESYRDSTIIMQLLRDNLNLWESEQNLQTTNEISQQ